MSRFFSAKYDKLVPYTPGEQPRDMKYVKLNTNESPFPPSPKTQQYAKEAAENLQLYSDPTCLALAEKAAAHFGVDKDEIVFTNGSDDILNFAMMAFCDAEHPAAFADITYGFYPVVAALNNIPCEIIPLKEDFTLDINDYLGLNKTIFIANPNAPTGIALSREQIEKVVASNPDSVVIVDEAYVDFGGESSVELIHKYDNVLVVQTCSKSRSLAGGRLGFAIGCKALIADLNTIRFSTNPYNINRMTMAAGIGAFEDDEVIKKNCAEIMRVRAFTVEELKKRGFTVLPSCANFIFAKSPSVPGKELYLSLKEKGVLVRHFDAARLTDYNRITIGSEEQMRILLEKIDKITEERA